MLLPSTVHVSSIIKRGVSGDWEICSSVVFRISSFAKHVYMYIIFVVSLVVGANRLYSGSMDNTIRVSLHKLFAINA